MAGTQQAFGNLRTRLCGCRAVTRAIRTAAAVGEGANGLKAECALEHAECWRCCGRRGCAGEDNAWRVPCVGGWRVTGRCKARGRATGAVAIDRDSRWWASEMDGQASLDTRKPSTRLVVVVVVMGRFGEMWKSRVAARGPGGWAERK